MLILIIGIYKILTRSRRAGGTALKLSIKFDNPPQFITGGEQEPGMAGNFREYFLLYLQKFCLVFVNVFSCICKSFLLYLQKFSLVFVNVFSCICKSFLLYLPKFSLVFVKTILRRSQWLALAIGDILGAL